MNTVGEEKESTKETILKTAAELFASKGYSKTSVREICRAAGVNVASVNYHFGNKENLYAKVVKYWKDIAFEKYPLDKCTDCSIPPEERLKYFIQCQLMHTLYTEESPWFGALMSRESLEPTGVLSQLTQESLGPGIEILLELIGEITGMDSENPKVRFLGASVLGQCTFYQYTPREMLDKYFVGAPFTEQKIMEISENIYRFSMNGIQAVLERKDENREISI